VTLLDSYHTYFRDVWPILREMSARGIPIDESRRAELKSLIDREDLRVTAEIQRIVPSEVLSNKQKSGLKRPPKDLSGLVEIEVVIEKEEKCQCLKKNRASCPVCLGAGTVPAGSVLRRWAEPVEFNPNSPLQVKRFMKFLKHPIPKHSKRTDSSGEASDTTEVKELERLFAKTKHPIYPLLIQKRQLTKVEGTYCSDGCGWAPAKDGCVHTTFGLCTGTWQTTSKAPNTQNGLKHSKTEFQKELALGFNRMQRAQPGKVLINFDFKSFHGLTTAHDFNIPDYARLARIDIHSFIACQFLKLPECKGLWERDDEDMLGLFKFLRKRVEFAACRDVPAKQTILGIQFGRGPVSIYTMYKEFFESVAEAKVIWSLVYALFPRLRIAQNEVKQLAAENKRLMNKYGAIRHFYDVQRWDRKRQAWVPGDQAEEAVAFLPASHAFGHFRSFLLKLRKGGFDERFGLCNQIHDSALFHCERVLAEECIAVVKPIMEERSEVLIYPGMAPEGLSVGADWAMGDCLAECK
jgi:DNA polymerase family A